MSAEMQPVAWLVSVLGARWSARCWRHCSSPGELLQFEGTAPHVIAHMRRALDAGRAFAGDVCNRGKQSRIYWPELDIQPIRDAQGVLTGFMAIQTDITERKQAEASLRASEAFLDWLRAADAAGMGPAI